MQFLSNLRSRIPLGWPGKALPGGNGLPALPGAGVYHYLRETTAGKARIHLRLESDGRGLLLVNASRAYHLNPTAACMAYLNLEGHAEETVRSGAGAPFSSIQSRRAPGLPGFHRSAGGDDQPG